MGGDTAKDGPPPSTDPQSSYLAPQIRHPSLQHSSRSHHRSLEGFQEPLDKFPNALDHFATNVKKQQHKTRKLQLVEAGNLLEPKRLRLGLL